MACGGQCYASQRVFTSPALCEGLESCLDVHLRSKFTLRSLGKGVGAGGVLEAEGGPVCVADRERGRCILSQYVDVRLCRPVIGHEVLNMSVSSIASQALRPYRGTSRHV